MGVSTSRKPVKVKCGCVGKKRETGESLVMGWSYLGHGGRCGQCGQRDPVYANFVTKRVVEGPGDGIWRGDRRWPMDKTRRSH